MDISKLTPEQRELAFKIGEAAERKGLNPDFVLPMVMQESGFDNSLVSKKGAVGVMQIMPDTAKLYKCDDPTNLNKNIDCGLNIIKDLVSKKNIGSDPYKVLAGYHSGEPEAATFLKTGNIDDLGPNAKQHLWDVSQRYGNELPNVLGGQQPEKESAAEAPAVPAPSTQGSPIASPNTTPAPMEISPELAGYVGGKAGAAVGTGAILAKAKFDTAKEAKDAWDALRSKMPNATPAADVAPTSAWPGTRTPATPSQAPVTPAQRLFEGAEDVAGLTGRERQTAYSEATSQRSAAAKTQEEVAKKLGLNPKQTFAQYPSVSSTPSGTIITKELRDELAARELVRQKQEAERIAALRKQNVQAAEKVGTPWQNIVAQKAADAAKQPSPILAYARRLAGLPVKGALAGAGFASEAADAYNRYNKGETGEAAIGGLGAVANLAAPFVGSMGALPSIGIAAPLYLSASDRIKRLAKHPEEVQLQESAYDAMGNPLR
jgi:hypothetical protein